jgi:hypothetical protein
MEVKDIGAPRTPFKDDSETSPFAAFAEGLVQLLCVIDHGQRVGEAAVSK